MAEVGYWGKDLKFEVSEDRVFTFGDMSRTVSGKWTEHEVVGSKPMSEFTGAELSKVTMTIVLSVMRGISVQDISDTVSYLEKAVEDGQVEYLYVGGKRIGERMMKIESMSEAWDKIYTGGVLTKATLQLTFSEYMNFSGEDGDGESTYSLTEYDAEADRVVIPWEYAVGDEVMFFGELYTKKNNVKEVAGYRKFIQKIVDAYPGTIIGGGSKKPRMYYDTVDEYLRKYGNPAKILKYQPNSVKPPKNPNQLYICHPWYMQVQCQYTQTALGKKDKTVKKKFKGWCDDGQFEPKEKYYYYDKFNVERNIV